MNAAHDSTPKNQWLYALASIAGLILLLVWMQGGFTRKVPPGTVQASESGAPPAGQTVAVTAKTIQETVSWPGTVSARTTAQVSPKVAARVLEIKVKAGDAVKAGQIVVRLDSRESGARLGQSRAALAAAQAQAERAGADLRRMQNLYNKEAATRQALEAAQAEAKSAQARVAEAQSAISGAESISDESTLRAPFDGVVVKRDLEPGDMALPGTPVLTLQSSQRMRIEAAISEQCARSLRNGSLLEARLGESPVDATVEEIAPAADPQSRTVLIKAGLPATTVTQPGAFGWIDQACGQRQVLLIPSAGVSRSGQLESVRLLVDGRPILRHVRTGKMFEGLVEVLAGVREGDLVLVGGFD